MDTEDFKQLYIPMRKHIILLCTSYLKCTEEAQDVTQEIYLKLWSMRKDLEDISNPKAFVMQMARNLCLDRLKKIKEEKMEDVQTTHYCQEIDMIEQLEAKDKIEIIKEWLRNQKEPKRSVFVMHHLQGLDFDEIAEKCSMSKINIRVTLSRMRAELKEIFE